MRGGFRGLRGFGDPAVAAAAARTIPPDQGGIGVQGKGLFFVYQTPSVASLAAGASSGAQTIQFDNNSMFTWLRTTIVADLAGAAQTNSTIVIPLVTVQITDTGNGMSFMNAPIPATALCGWGELPFILPIPQFIQPNASYSFTFANYSAGTTYLNLRMQLIGFRTFNP
jgi:hypothetical protein